MTELQEQYLDLMKIFAALCEEHSLRYYITGGTLLGAVRHEGFIPWDDDIDIAMPRRDYEKLIRHSEEWIESPYKVEHYSLRNFGKKEKIYNMILLFTNENITLICKKNNEVVYDKLSLDVIPIDGMPDNIICEKLHLLYLLWLRACFKFTMINNVDENENERNVFERMLIKFIKYTKVGNVLSPVDILRRLDHALSKYDMTKYHKYAGAFLGAYRTREIVDGELWRNRVKYTFETEEFWGLKDYDKYLSLIYGDYMSLPPKNKRKGRHHVIGIEYAKSLI